MTVGEFDGRETLWSIMTEEEQEMEVSIHFALSEGQAKIAYIDADGNVITLAESAEEGKTELDTTESVWLKKGKNRFKVVGYDCRDLDVKLLFEEL